MNIIDQPLLERLITHEDFLVKDEYTLYCIVKEWTIENLMNREDYDFSVFYQRPNSPSFLLTADGEPYVNLFKKIRLSSAMLVKKNIEALKNDNIIPLEWIEEAGAVALAQMMTMSTGAEAVLPHIPTDYFRVAIFHPEKAMLFVDQKVNFYGVHLQFRWNTGVLSVGRCRFESDKIVSHGICKLEFRITLYCKKKYVTIESCEEVIVVTRKISENETHNLYGNEPDYRHEPLIYSFSIIRKQMYPTRIGIEIKYLGGSLNY